MANKQHAQFSDENGNIYYLENQTEDVLDPSGKPLSDGGDLSEASVTFTADSTRTLPKSGSRFKAFCGSVLKFLSDLKTVSFSGSYNDLSNKPSIPSGAAASQAVANNCTTTAAGSVLDARQGKVLMDKANQLSSELESEQNKTYSRLSLSRDHHDDYMQQAIDAGLDRTNAEISVSGFIAFSVWCIDGVYIVFCYRTENKDYAGFISKIGESKSYSFYRYNGQNSVLKEL